MHNIRRLNLLLFGIAVAILFVVFNQWFKPSLISSGDLWPFANSMYEARSLPLSAWDPFGNNGFGGFSGPFLWIHLNFALPITLIGQFLGLSWVWVVKVGYLIPFLILSFITPIVLYKKLFHTSKFYLLAGLIYTLNTYILMIVGGGQVAGIGMAYALAPLVLFFWIRLIESQKFDIPKSLSFALITSLQIMYDLRIAYITLATLGIYLLFKINKKNLKSIILNSLLAGVGVALLNAYWLVPSLVVHQDPFSTLGSEYSSLDAVRFFSFAKIENTLSLLHANWPENIFGMTTFLKPEFLLIPILAFSSLLFLPKDKTQKRNILFLATIALVGTFIAKGTQDPFGFVYIALFENFPGFVLFRDPTKWMVCIALAYTILIPYSIETIYKYLKIKFK